MFNDQAKRLVRKSWRTIDEFAYELFLLLVSPSDITHTGTITIVNPGSGSPITITSSSGSVTFSNAASVAVLGKVTDADAAPVYECDLYEDGPDEAATETGISVTRLTPPAGVFSDGDWITVFRFPNGLDSSGQPQYLYYSPSRIA